MTAERKSDNLTGALLFTSGIVFGTAVGLGAAEIMKNPSIITNLSNKVKSILPPKRRAV